MLRTVYKYYCKENFWSVKANEGMPQERVNPESQMYRRMQ